jgi:hypothetical protein
LNPQQLPPKLRARNDFRALLDRTPPPPWPQTTPKALLAKWHRSAPRWTNSRRVARRRPGWSLFRHRSNPRLIDPLPPKTARAHHVRTMCSFNAAEKFQRL